ncbi:neurofilament heavy polypeptide-like isoform X2 [Hyperolius riggenbachi]|uniref:neurofilament heavy polypeptide-like isoform X2 n=1 Tax=Hyperolius riggenbachi TaxID=752182 RepID=UPI0035A2A434
MAAKKAGKSKAKAKTPVKHPGGGKAKKTAKTAVKCPRTAPGPAKVHTTKPAGKPKQANKINKGMKQAGMVGGIGGPRSKPKKKNPIKTAVPGVLQNNQPAAQKKKAVKRKQAQPSQAPGPAKVSTTKPAGKPKQIMKINKGMIPAGVLGGIAGPSSKPKKKNPTKTAIPGALQNNQPAAQKKKKAVKRKQTQPSQAAVSIKRRKTIKTDPAAQMNFVERPPIHFSMSSPPIQPPSVIHVHPVQQMQPFYSNPPPIQDLYNNFQREIPSQSQSDSRTTDSESHQIIKDLRHFVDEHRQDLIGKINPVEPILDDLLNKELLKQEQYDNCKSKETSQSQMRELFGYVRGWGNPDKDIFLQILEHHNEPIIRGLRE